MNAAVQGFSLVSIIALIRKEIERAKTEGPQGKEGKAGATGERGAKGDTGPQGKQGPKGGDGKQGKAGKDGKDGEDAEAVSIANIEQDVDDAIVITMTDGETYTIEMPLGEKTTEVHYKVGGGSGSNGGESGSIDLSNYVQKPASDASWMVYKKGTGWAPVTTDLVATNPEVIFRDTKGRFKSTKGLEELTNQLEVNRYFAEQLEAVEGGVPGQDGAPGKDGADGQDGAPGEKGDKGDKGDKGEDGAGGVEEAPNDGAWYGRRNSGWMQAPAYAKEQTKMISNTAQVVFRQPRNPTATTHDFELSVGPLTRGAYVENEVEETAAILANWADYDTITFSDLDYSLRHTDVGDIIEVGEAGIAERCGTLLKITSASVEQTDKKFFGFFGYELVGVRHEDEVVQKNTSYFFHLLKQGGSDGGIEEAPDDGKLYVRNGDSWEALPPMNDDYTGTNPSLVTRNASGNSKFQWFSALGMTFLGSKKENKEDDFVLSGGTDGTNNVYRNSIESFRDSMDVYTKAEVDALGVGGGGAAWTYYPDEYRFGNHGFGGYTKKEFWTLSAETLDPDLEGSGGEQANKLEEVVMLHRLEATTISGSYLQIYPTEMVIRSNAQGDPGRLEVDGSLEVKGQAYFRNAFSLEHTVLGGINITATDVDLPDGFPYSAEEKSIQPALTVDHAELGRTVEIDKEGTIRARAFTDMDGNPVGGGIEEAPDDNQSYVRKNAGWITNPSYTKAQIRRIVNANTASSRDSNYKPAESTVQFQLSGGPVSKNVDEMAATLIKWADHNIIKFNILEYNLRHAEVGDYLTIGDINKAERTGVMLELTSADVTESNGRYSGTFGYTLVGTRNDDEVVQKNQAYSFRLQKKHRLSESEKQEIVDLIQKGPTYDCQWNDMDGGTLSNRPGYINSDAECTEDIEWFSFYPEDLNGVALPTFNKPFIAEFTFPDGNWVKYLSRSSGQLISFQCDRIECSLTGSCAVWFSKYTGELTKVRFYEAPETRQISRSDLVQSFTELQHAVADEKTIKGLKEALHNALGGLIEKFEG